MADGRNLAGTSETEKSYYQQAVLTAGVLAGILFVALIFVFEYYKQYYVPLLLFDAQQSYHLLTSILGCGSGLLGGVSVIMMPLASGHIESKGRYAWVVRRMFEAGLFAFMAGLWIIVFDNSLWGAGFMTVIDGISLVMFFYPIIQKKRNLPQNDDY